MIQVKMRMTAVLKKVTLRNNMMPKNVVLNQKKKMTLLRKKKTVLRIMDHIIMKKIKMTASRRKVTLKITFLTTVIMMTGPMMEKSLVISKDET